MPKLEDQIKMTGQLVIELHGPDGKLKERREIKNLVVTAGKNFIASRMVGVAKNVMSHMAVGTNNTAPAVGQTALSTELHRQALTSGTAANNVATYVASWAAGVGTGAIVEAGIFNAGAAGDMLARTTFNVVNKEAADSMSITWTVTVN